jgi:hypothetical protein
VKEVSIYGLPYANKNNFKTVIYQCVCVFWEMIRNLDCQNLSQVQTLILMQREPESIQVWKEILHGKEFSKIHVPEMHDMLQFI